VNNLECGGLTPLYWIRSKKYFREIPRRNESGVKPPHSKVLLSPRSGKGENDEKTCNINFGDVVVGLWCCCQISGGW
jgi:hypothetical protein